MRLTLPLAFRCHCQVTEDPNRTFSHAYCTRALVSKLAELAAPIGQPALSRSAGDISSALELVVTGQKPLKQLVDQSKRRG